MSGMRVYQSEYLKLMLDREMTHDEAIYPSPFTFDPSRFLKDGRLSDTIQDPRSMFFGFGRRYTSHLFQQLALSLTDASNVVNALGRRWQTPNSLW